MIDTNAENRQQRINLIGCMCLYFICGAVYSTLGAVLEHYLMDVSGIVGEKWFFLGAAVPTIIDVAAITLFTYYKCPYREIIIVSSSISLVGVVIMSFPKIYTILIGRAIIGIIYSQYPFLCLIVSSMKNKEKKQALFNAVGLSGYFVSPIFLYFDTQINDVLFFCGLLCVGAMCCCILYIHPINNPGTGNLNINLDHGSLSSDSTLTLVYFVLLQIAVNLSASSVFYIAPPLCTNIGMTQPEIALILAGIIFVQICVSLIIYFKKFEFLKINTSMIIYSIVSLTFIGLFIQYNKLNELNLQTSLNIKIITSALLFICAVPISAFMWTSVQFVNILNNKEKMMGANGVIVSTMYFVGPLLNGLFLIYPILPFLVQVILWGIVSYVHSLYFKVINFNN